MLSFSFQCFSIDWNDKGLYQPSRSDWSDSFRSGRMGSVCQIRLKYMRHFYSDSDYEWKIRLHVNVSNVSLVATALELLQLSTVFFLSGFVTDCTGMTTRERVCVWESCNNPAACMSLLIKDVRSTVICQTNCKSRIRNSLWYNIVLSSDVRLIHWQTIFEVAIMEPVITKSDNTHSTCCVLNARTNRDTNKDPAIYVGMGLLVKGF